jgi:hypothetical protein
MPGSFDANLRSRIDEINATINRWRPLPANPVEFVDPESFTGDNFLVKTGDQIKIRTHYKGDLNINYDLAGTGDRIGIGRDFLVMLYRRLGAFKKLLDDEAAKK